MAGELEGSRWREVGAAGRESFPYRRDISAAASRNLSNHSNQMMGDYAGRACSGEGEVTLLDAEPTVGSAPPWAGAAAPAPAVRRRENLRSASFHDYALAGVTPGRGDGSAVLKQRCGTSSLSDW